MARAVAATPAIVRGESILVWTRSQRSASTLTRSVSTAQLSCHGTKLPIG